jgi:serine/threonine protein kinase
VFLIVSQVSLLLYFSCIFNWLYTGSVTRSEAWEDLVSDRGLRSDPTIPESTSEERVQLRKLELLAKTKFDNETSMYDPVITTIQSSLYPTGTSSLHVIDTHKRVDLAADITVARFADGRVAYAQRYWIELKVQGSSLTSHAVRGQMLGYLRNSSALQPWRTEVIGILSNLDEAWIFTGTDSPNGFKVTVAKAPTFADAILFAHERTKDLKDKFPDPAPLFEGPVEVISATKEHYLYSASAEDPQSRKHRIVVVKVAVDSTRPNLENEISFLKRLSVSPHKNIATYFWSSEDYSQLAITPRGCEITTKEPASVSRSLIYGLLDGLEWLHSHRIVHRDIRLANVIINNGDEAVIIDFQTAVDLDMAEDIPYLGGRICWPRRLLSSNDKDKLYTPTPQDDLHAAILFVMHLLFPPQFNAFNVQNIMRHSPLDRPTTETRALLKLWDNITSSPLLSRFVKAADECCNTELREMASLFYSPEAFSVIQ